MSNTRCPICNEQATAETFRSSRPNKQTGQLEMFDVTLFRCPNNSSGPAKDRWGLPKKKTEGKHLPHKIETKVGEEPMPTITPELKARVTEARKKAGLTTKQFAQTVPMSDNYLSQVLSNVSVSSDLLGRIERAATRLEQKSNDPEPVSCAPEVESASNTEPAKVLDQAPSNERLTRIESSISALHREWEGLSSLTLFKEEFVEHMLERTVAIEQRLEQIEDEEPIITDEHSGILFQPKTVLTEAVEALRLIPSDQRQAVLTLVRCLEQGEQMQADLHRQIEASRREATDNLDSINE